MAQRFTFEARETNKDHQCDYCSLHSGILRPLYNLCPYLNIWFRSCFCFDMREGFVPQHDRREDMPFSPSCTSCRSCSCVFRCGKVSCDALNRYLFVEVEFGRLCCWFDLRERIVAWREILMAHDWLEKSPKYRQLIIHLYNSTGC